MIGTQEIPDTAPPKKHTARETRTVDWRPAADALRGVWAVLVLIVTAVDVLLTALLGIRPVCPVLARIGRVIAAEYRAAAHGYVIGEPDNDDDDVEP